MKVKFFGVLQYYEKHFSVFSDFSLNWSISFSFNNDNKKYLFFQWELVIALLFVLQTMLDLGEMFMSSHVLQQIHSLQYEVILSHAVGTFRNDDIATMVLVELRG
jgi:hypothetical protein